MDLDALIAKAKTVVDTVQPVDQDVILGEEVVTVRMWPLTGPAWRDLTAKHPWREGAQFDQMLGYNIDGVVADYPRVYIVQGDDVEDVAVAVTTKDGSKRTRWQDICDLLSGPDLQNLALVVWGMNEMDPSSRVSAAGKASKGGRRKKRSSPVSSASPSGN